jgi:hypothetical protein
MVTETTFLIIHLLFCVIHSQLAMNNDISPSYHQNPIQLFTYSTSSKESANSFKMQIFSSKFPVLFTDD